METYENLIGNQEDWANYITNVEMRDTPFLDWLPVGAKPVNVLRSYQADKYAAPEKNSHVDGQPWGNFRAAGDNRGRLKALIQWFDKTTSVSKLTEDVSQPAGVTEGELARDIPKRMKEMASDMEANFLEDWDCREDTKTEGYLTRAVGSWISSSAQTLYPVPTAFLTPSASINSTALASMTEDEILTVLQSMAQQTKTKELVSAFVGPGLKKKISGFQFYLPSSASTQASGVTFNQSGKDKTITRSIDRYESDFGPVEINLNWFLANIDGTTAKQTGRGYFLHQTKWELCWNQKPKAYRLPFKGGSYEAAMDAIAMLVCKNPQGEGKYAPTA